MQEYHEKKVMTKNRNFWIGAEIARSGNSSKKYGIFIFGFSFPKFSFCLKFKSSFPIFKLLFTLFLLKYNLSIKYFKKNIINYIIILKI